MLCLQRYTLACTKAKKTSFICFCARLFVPLFPIWTIRWIATEGWWICRNHRWWAFGLFPGFGDYEWNCYMNYSAFCVDLCLHFSWVNSKNGIIELYSNCIFNFIFLFFGHTRDRSCAPAFETRSLNHWTTREIPRINFIRKYKRSPSSLVFGIITFLFLTYTDMKKLA